MKKFALTTRTYAIICCCFCLSVVKAQVTIPDANMAAALRTLYPTCMSGNVLNTSCPEVVNETSLILNYESISNLTGVQYFTSLTHLECIGNQLTSLPPLPPNLTYINFDYNQINVWPALPSTVTDVEALNNLLPSISSLPPNLQIFSCDNNKLSNLPTLPASLKELYCGANTLTTLPTLPQGLEILRCGYMPSLTLPAFPNTLIHLECPNNDYVTLPALPPNLQKLYCASNKLIQLPVLPNTLFTLDVGFNRLHSLPATLPTSLTQLYCASDSLTALPTLPQTLVYLFCYTNQLTTLPPLPGSLLFIQCYNNKLVSLPPFPPVVFQFDAHNNPNLKCLPYLQQFRGSGTTSFNIANTGIKCLPNAIPHPLIGYLPAVDTLPLCNINNNPNYCSPGGNIQGTVYLLDTDTCPNVITGTKLFPVKMNIYEGATLLQSAYFPGSYSFFTGFSTYTVSVDKELPFISPCAMDSTLVVNSADSVHYNVDFGLKCKPGFDLGVKSVVGRARPGAILPFFITAGDVAAMYNGHCASGVTGLVKITINGPAVYNGPAQGALTPDNVSGNTITWTIPDFGQVDPFTAFNIMLKVNDNAIPGNKICISVSVTPKEGDNNPKNNSLNQCITVTNSLDPNEKVAYPIGTIDTAEKWVTYTIHFQNTGTDTAYRIVLRDTLDDNLDPTTFELLAYSNKTIVRNEYKIVQFNFPYINLPDSFVNEPKSHGYVQFRVKIRDNLAEGAQIKNSASIYFDNNDPVRTNTTVNIFTNPVLTNPFSFNNEPGIKIYPNPANSKVQIIVQGFQPEWIYISDLSGKKLTSQKFEPVLDISSLNAGIYFIEVKGTDGTAVKRLIKL